MDLCDSCLEITTWIAVPYGQDLPHTPHSDTPRMRQRIFERSPRPTCHFCVALYSALGIGDDRKEDLLSIEVSVSLSRVRSARGLYDFCVFIDRATQE
jgi:hypothetical protein